MAAAAFAAGLAVLECRPGQAVALVQVVYEVVALAGATAVSASVVDVAGRLVVAGSVAVVVVLSLVLLLVVLTTGGRACGGGRGFEVWHGGGGGGCGGHCLGGWLPGTYGAAGDAGFFFLAITGQGKGGKGQERDMGFAELNLLLVCF